MIDKRVNVDFKRKKEVELSNLNINEKDIENATTTPTCDDSAMIVHENATIKLSKIGPQVEISSAYTHISLPFPTSATQKKVSISNPYECIIYAPKRQNYSLRPLILSLILS